MKWTQKGCCLMTLGTDMVMEQMKVGGSSRFSGFVEVG